MPPPDAPPTPDTGRPTAWVSAWGDAVRVSPGAVGLVELASARLVELSADAADVLGTTQQLARGLDYFSVVERPDESAMAFQLVRGRMLDGAQGRKRYRRGDGSVVELRAYGRIIRSDAETDLALWVFPGPETGSDPAAADTSDVAALFPLRLAPADGETAHLTVGIRDDRWEVTTAETRSDELLGHRPSELIGVPLVDLVHPEDVAVVLLALARATTDGKTPVCVRLQHRDDGWGTVKVTVTLFEAERGPHFELALTSTEVRDPPPHIDRIGQLEQHLRRIASEVGAADVLDTPEAVDLTRLPALLELPARQLEVVARLVRGERVPTIARQMYLSQSTVRNHLSAIFHKVGVHSQEELLMLLRHPPDDAPSFPT